MNRITRARQGEREPNLPGVTVHERAGDAMWITVHRLPKSLAETAGTKAEQKDRTVSQILQQCVSSQGNFHPRPYIPATPQRARPPAVSSFSAALRKFRRTFCDTSSATPADSKRSVPQMGVRVRPPAHNDVTGCVLYLLLYTSGLIYPKCFSMGRKTSEQARYLPESIAIFLAA